ncbi:MAG TPA: hypothetical protein EYH45_01685 [Candidatus Caldiarchaeum subterraneum]|uniref:Uncharacterized protein n=1 Tax=Caldiarchaeum subterraneum TaxID=311458 RepID=A0A832ZVU9_CALS0|nr:hypothetical protein [Candidatus Caldarchaeum subterraneum]
MYRERRRGGVIIWVIGFIIFSLLFSLIGREILEVWLNVWEFGELFIKPFYFSLVGGVILSAIAFIRYDFVKRKSLTIWIIRTLIFSSRGVFSPALLDFERFRLSPVTFAMWQVTKLIAGTFILSNALFGMAVLASLNGWDSGLRNVPAVFSLPFRFFSIDDTSGAEVVIESAPALTLLLPPILGAVGIRLFLLIGLTHLIRVIAHAVVSYLENGVITVKTSIIEALISLALAWTGFNLFFPSYIDYNTKVFIIASFIASALFGLYAYWDLRRIPVMRSIYLRAGAILLLILATASVVTIQNSIADGQKLQWRGPYVAQEIAVNRYLAELDDVEIKGYEFSLVAIPPEEINDYVRENNDILSRIRLWDWDAAFAKLKPEIGLIPYVDFEDSDILRFNKTLYWSASMKPVLPETVSVADRWYNEHLVYTHIPEGFLMLNAQSGDVVEPGLFFKKRKIYYGEGNGDSLFSRTWAAIIMGKETVDEIGGVRYSGEGGVKISPPLSWVYDITFFLSYPDKTIQLLRYRDVHDRVRLVMPYFTYLWRQAGQVEWVDMLPVTDGSKSYWLMPLIISLSTENLPWSKGNSLRRLVGFALIDAYNGDIQIIVTGDDFFSRLFANVYSEYVARDVPEWLRNQLRYPAEIFRWRVEMFNIYHVVEVAKFIQAREFYEIPRGLDVYYILGKPPGFDDIEFVGILSLEIRGAQGRNLAGYVIALNDYPDTGRLIFYAVPPESDTKLLGPTAAREALERDPEFRKIRTLLTTDPQNPPRIGETIFYDVGKHPVYFIPVYTAQAGGVVTQIGIIAAVGAAFTGQYYVGLGSTGEEAFTNFLRKLVGATAPEERKLTTEEKIQIVIEFLEKKGYKVENPEEINANLVFSEGSTKLITESDLSEVEKFLESFISDSVEPTGVGRLIYWMRDDTLNVGIVTVEDGVVVLRYVSILLG